MKGTFDEFSFSCLAVCEESKVNLKNSGDQNNYCLTKFLFSVPFCFCLKWGFKNPFLFSVMCHQFHLVGMHIRGYLILGSRTISYSSCSSVTTNCQGPKDCILESVMLSCW